MPTNDLTHLLSYDEQREAKNNVSFRSLHAEMETFETPDLDPDLHVRGEVVGLVDPLPHSLKLSLSVFDTEDRLVGDASRVLAAARFLEFEAFHLLVELSQDVEIARLRLHTSARAY